MSSVPTGTSTCATAPIIFARRSASGTPRRRTPINARSFVPPLFSTISWASLWRVRPISSAERSCLFSTTRIGCLILAQTAANSEAPIRSGILPNHLTRMIDYGSLSSPEPARISERHPGVDLRVSIGTLSLKNPIIAASGTFAYGVEFAHLVDLNRLGGIAIKGLSLQPMAGAPAPRLCDTPSGMINAVGLQNIGVHAFVAEKLPQLRRYNTAVIANVFGHTI